jgi:hypothetical protein
MRVCHAISEILQIGLKKVANGEIFTPLAKFSQHKQKLALLANLAEVP